MSLGKTLYPLLSAGTTQEDPPDITEILLTGMLRIKSNKPNYSNICIVVTNVDPDQTAP